MARGTKRARNAADTSATFACDTCGKAFKHSSNLTRHVKTMHGGERPFACDTCGKTFKERSDLTRHVKTVHGGVMRRTKRARTEAEEVMLLLHLSS